MLSEIEKDNIYRFENLLRKIDESNRGWRSKRDYTDDKETDGKRSAGVAGKDDDEPA